ncbi:putative repeat protein (TIGR01451 family) [Breoghania corrubedonensis]|uniref:Putative repeat protein (TIGR01451 family) n=1 Tax=Breoghania corrubedonensis TaxID=665038 RepID=A0A2T5V7G0_9HYPH|nr:NEW3 domain-containing protein [Breoghania corrubedonensis]PTW59694.1 putative repeat protein (TIGR01451 family) [Breoghania corrubedonensis]
MSLGRAWLSAFAAASLITILPASAETMMMGQDQAQPVRGLWLTTPFPERTVDFGDTVKLDISLKNKAMPPERVELALDGLPEGWTSEIDGSGSKVSAAIVGTDDTETLHLILTPPKDSPKSAGTFAFNVRGTVENATPGAPSKLDLPIKLTMAEARPAKLTLDPKLPSLRGTAKSSFDFELKLKNDSPKDTVVNLASKAPDGFQVAFTEGYGSQEITSLPVKANETKTIKAKVKAPQNVAAGTYDVAIGAQSDSITAAAPLHLQITGQPKIALMGPGGLLSGTATAGEERDFTFTVANTGSDTARDVTLTARAPSGWKAEMEPKTLGELAPDAKQEISLHLTPAKNAVAGDYMTSVRASGSGVSNSADFRVTVATSTLWGATGLGVIAAALLVMAVGVRRYGRR